MVEVWAVWGVEAVLGALVGAQVLEEVVGDVWIFVSLWTALEEEVRLRIVRLR